MADETSFKGARCGHRQDGGGILVQVADEARAKTKRVMISSRSPDHCLADLVYRWRIGEIAMEPVGIIANHPRETYAHIDPATSPSTTCP